MSLTVWVDFVSVIFGYSTLIEAFVGTTSGNVVFFSVFASFAAGGAMGAAAIIVYCRSGTRLGGRKLV